MFLLLSLLSISISASNFAADTPSIKPSCMMMYLASMESNLPSDFAKLDDLPKTIRMTSTEAASGKSFAMANKAWRMSAPVDKAWDTVDALAGGVYEMKKPELLDQLKSIQRYSDNIKNSYALFDQAHEAPVQWGAFSASLKDLQTAIENGEDISTVSVKAEALSGSFAKLPDTEMLKKLQPEAKAGFKKYISQNVKEMNALLKKPKLSIDDYHVLQKHTQTLTTYFQAQLAMDPSPEGQKIVAFLKTKSNQLAETHTTLLGLKNNPTPDYYESKLPLDADLKKDMLGFMSRVDLDPPKQRKWQRPRGSRPYENN